MTDIPTDLPEAFTQARRRDEPFWRYQEHRIQGSLGQPCCTLSGISSGLISMEGNFAVIVHGEHECASCFRHLGPSAHNFFCTGLTEREFVTGETSEPLRRCLRLVATEVNPDAIFVLGACPVEVIGDRFERVVEEVAAEHPKIPMLALHTSGLKVGSQAAMLDWMFSTLASVPTLEPVDAQWKHKLGSTGREMLSTFFTDDPHAMDWAQREAGRLPEREKLDPSRCLNLLGFPDSVRRGGTQSEAEGAFTKVGLHLIGNFPSGATFNDWRAIGHARATFIADRSLYPKLVKALEGRGQLVIEVPLPIGAEQTAEFYRLVGEVYDEVDTLTEATAELAAQARARVAGFRADHEGLRVAMGLRMLNNYAADQLAYQGLGDYRALAELGFDLTLMVQGPPDKEAKFQTLFSNRGVTHPFEVFPEPWNLSEHIGGDRFDVAYLADHCRAEARKAGVPMIVSRAMEPFYSGVDGNLLHIERMLRQTRR